MARVEVPIVAATRDGSYMPDTLSGDVTNGNALPNDGRVGLVVTNTSTDTPHDLTVRLSRTVDGQPVVPRVLTLPANTAKIFGPFSTADYGSAVALDVDSSDLTLMAVRVS